MFRAEISFILELFCKHNKYVLLVMFLKYSMLIVEIMFIQNLLYNIYNIKMLFDVKTFYKEKSFVQKLFFL
jgi:hypothetical protein